MYEVWADMVEAAIGFLAIIEGVPGLGAYFTGPFDEIRSNMEASIDDLIRDRQRLSETICEHLGLVDAKRPGVPFTFTARSLRTHGEWKTSDDAVWSDDIDDEDETTAVPVSKSVTPDEDSTTSASLCICGSALTIATCTCPLATMVDLMTSTHQPHKRRRLPNLTEWTTLASHAYATLTAVEPVATTPDSDVTYDTMIYINLSTHCRQFRGNLEYNDAGKAFSTIGPR